MISRAQVRRLLIRVGLGVGAAGVLIYLMSFVGWLAYGDAYRDISFGRGGIIVTWSGQQRGTQVAPTGGGAPTFVPSAVHVGFQVYQAQWVWLPRLTYPQRDYPWGELVIPAWVMIGVGLLCVYRLLPPGGAPGMCPQCGFDLTKTPRMADAPERVRCPECGRVSRAAGDAVKSA